MKKLALFLITSIVITSCCAQNLKRNTVYLEAGGSAIFYSVNYERLLLPGIKHNIALRGGASYINFFDSPRRQGIAVPVGLSYLKKLKTKYFEAGISFGPIYDYYHFTIEGDKYAELILVPAIRVGIRKQPVDDHFF